MPGYCASNALPSFSPTGRSIDEYRITLPSFFAASTRSGVIDTAAGAAAITRVDHAVRPSAAEPLMRSRRDNFFRIVGLLFVIARSQRVRPLAGPMINSATKQSSTAALDCFAALATTA